MHGLILGDLPFQALAEHSPDGIARFDRALRYVYANPAIATIVGIPPAQLLGKTHRELMLAAQPVAPWDEVIQRVFSSGRAETIEFSLTTPDGLRFYQSLVVPEGEPEQPIACVLVSTRDLTPQKHLEAQLQHLQATSEAQVAQQTVLLERKVDRLQRDLFQHQQVEHTLRTSEAKFAAAFHFCPEAIAISSFPEGRYLEVNKGFWHLTEYYPDAVVGFTAVELELWPSTTQTDLVQQLQEVGTIRNHECLIQTHSGRVKTVLLSAEVLHLNGQQCLLTIAKDISDLKQTEAALRASEEQFRSIFDNVSVGIALLNPQGYVLTINEADCRFLGYTQSELIGMHFSQFTYPDDLALDMLCFKSLLRQERDSYTLDKRYVRKDGDVVWGRLTVSPLCNEDGSIRAIAVVCEDINTRKQVEAAWRESEERWQLALRGNNDGIWDWNVRTNEVFFSTRWKTMLGYSDAEISNHLDEWSRRVHPEDFGRVMVAIQDHFCQKTSFYSTEHRLRCKDGSYKWILDRGQALWDEAGNVVRMTGSHTDITERKQAEEASRQQAERERLLSLITQRIRQSLDIGTILTTTVTEVRQLLQADRVVIYRVYPDGTGKVITEAIAPSQPAILDQPLPHEIFPQECHARYCAGRIRIVVDVEQDPMSPCLAETLRQLGVKSKLVVPILLHSEQDDLQETLWGLLIAHQCEAPRQWQQAEAELLQQLASQVGIAIQQSELYQRVQQLNARLEHQVQERTAELQQALNFEALLKRITDKVRDSLDESQILQTAVQELAIGLETDACDAALYDLRDGNATIAYEYLRSNLPSAKGHVLHLDDLPDVHAQLLQGHYVLFCPATAQALAAIGKGLEQTCAILCCPLIDDQGVLGDLWLFKPSQACFSLMEIRLAQQVANQCAIALRQARLYQAAQAQVAELERLNRLKDDFLSTVSHELRSPMASIKMATQMLEISFQQLEALSAETSAISRYFHILRNECDRETHLINDLLDLSRLEAGTEPLQILTMDPKTWILHVSEPFLNRAQSQAQLLEFVFPETLPTLTTDFFYLERILTELLNNACKYTPAGETITISAGLLPAVDSNQPLTHQPLANQLTNQLTNELLIKPSPQSLTEQPQSTNQEPDSLQICVSNSGVEISRTEQTRIFDKFYRIPNNDPWKHGGTGLGLALVKKLTEQIQATIAVDSQPGLTIFTVTLPLAPLVNS